MPHTIRAAFAESYYDHQCNVATELDVLETDIRGYTWRVKFKRWFYSWFLLSYDDERCRIFFVSSHALRLERARHYRRYRGTIHPLSRFSKVWTIFYFIILIVNRMLFHINTALFYGSQTSFTIIFGIICESMVFFDLIVNFKTGYTDEDARKIVLDATMGYAHFASTKLFLHVASAIPLQTMMLLRYGLHKCVVCRANVFICTLKLISLFTVLRVYDASSFLGRQRSSFTMTHICRCLRITTLALLTMLHLMDFIDTVNILIMLKVNMVYKHSYLEMVMNAKASLPKVSDVFYMAVEFSNLCKAVMLFGYGLYRNDYYLDKIFSLVCHICGHAFFTWGACECYAIVQRQKYANDEMWVRRERTRIWMTSSQLSDMINDKVTEYFHTNLSSPNFIEKHNDLYKFLPTNLIKEIKLNTYYSFVRRIPYFAEWPVEIVEELTILLKEDIYLERDFIAHPFTQGEGLVIVFAGVLAVYTVAQKETGHLIDGDYFGELSLVTDKELQTSAVNAVTACQVLKLNKRPFRKLMRKYPDLFYEFRNILLQKHENHSTSDVQGLPVLGRI